ncbi:hypothetical protein D3C75_849800 [compost metagenome]
MPNIGPDHYCRILSAQVRIRLPQIRQVNDPLHILCRQLLVRTLLRNGHNCAAVHAVYPKRQTGRPPLAALIRNPVLQIGASPLTRNEHGQPAAAKSLLTCLVPHGNAQRKT